MAGSIGEFGYKDDVQRWFWVGVLVGGFGWWFWLVVLIGG